MRILLVILGLTLTAPAMAACYTTQGPMGINASVQCDDGTTGYLQRGPFGDIDGRIGTRGYHSHYNRFTGDSEGRIGHQYFDIHHNTFNGGSYGHVGNRPYESYTDPFNGDTYGHVGDRHFTTHHDPFTGGTTTYDDW
jgi:hypothetical protein